MGRFPGFTAVQIEIVVPKGMQKKLLDRTLDEITNQAVTVLKKGIRHIARATAAEGSDFDRVVITLMPTTPNDSWSALARRISDMPADPIIAGPPEDPPKAEPPKAMPPSTEEK